MRKQLIREVRTARRAFMLTVALHVLSGAIVIGQAWLLSHVIRRTFLEGAPLEAVSGVVWALVGVVLARALVTAAASDAAAQVAIHVKDSLRRRFMAQVVALGPSYTQGERSGELVTTAGEGIEALDAYFRDYLPGLFSALLIPLLILVVVFPIDLLTFVVLLITAPLIPLMMALIGMGARAVAQRQYASMSLLGAHFLDVMQGLTTLKLFNRSRYQIETIRRITYQFKDATMSVLRVAFLSAFMLEMLATLSVAIVAVEIGLRLIYSGIGFEQALFLLVIAPEFYLPLRALGAKFHAGTEGLAAAERIYTVLNASLPDTSQATQPAPDGMHLTFEDVMFAYDDGARPALNGLSFTVEDGQHVALVGASGAGKSTVLALLLRFIAPQSGRITVSGVDLPTIDIDAWRARVAWVAQSPYLFNGTIAENIRLGQPEASQAAVEQAARSAGAHDFIVALPQGYDTPVGERGARLSGGQAQRIAIARAFLRDAPLLIMDEPTANLDPDSERHVQAALSRLMQGRTVITVAHRLNTITQADRIVVMHEGRAAQIGTHAALMQSGGLYAELVKAYAQESAVYDAAD